jgi:proline dehydrogenase
VTRPLSNTAETGAISGNSRLKDQRVAYLIGGTAVAIVALLYRKGDSQFPDDPRDVEALSTVPLSKLISGWTYV